jgi:ATP-dependent Clp protease adaptor protein ClpS
MIQTEVIEKISEIGIDTNGNAQVILFNDDFHSFEDVINQLMRAVSCSAKQAENFAWEVHTNGKSKVYRGEMDEALHVSAVLQEINLKTEIQF